MTTPTDSKLVAHARAELTKLGEDDATIEQYLDVIRAFELLDHPKAARDVIDNLLNWKNLTELTQDPSEWNKIASGVWQSTRNPQAFSMDGGETYTLLTENYTIHNSEVPPVTPPTA